MITEMIITATELAQALAKSKVLMPEDENVSDYELEVDIVVNGIDLMIVAKIDRKTTYSSCKGDYLTPSMTDIENQSTEIYDVQIISEEGEELPMEDQHTEVIQKYFENL